MGTVHFTQGHHQLCCHNTNPDMEKRVLLTPELMDIAISCNPFEIEPIRDSSANMTWAALRGLTRLKGFNAAISTIFVAGKEPHLCIPHRTWGEISLGEPNNLIVRFSHDSRFHNEPFVSLYQWLEGQCPEKGVDDATFHAFESEWSDPEKWHTFFKDKIRQKATHWRNQAKERREEAHQFVLQAKTVEEVLD